MKRDKASLTFGVLARNCLAHSLSFPNLISNTCALFALVDIVLYLSTNGIKHQHRLPVIGIWSWVLKRLQVDGDSLCLGDNLSVLIIFWKFVGPFGDLRLSFLAV